MCTVLPAVVLRATYRSGDSVLVLLERFELLGRCVALVLGLPFAKWHAVDDFASFVLGELGTAFAGWWWWSKDVAFRVNSPTAGATMQVRSP